MKIIVDGQGGDKAPLEIVKGCALALESLPDAEIIITGEEEVIKNALNDAGVTNPRITVVAAGVPLTMEDAAKSVVGSKKDSSMGLGLKMLSENAGDAFVSAGNSGALLLGGSLVVRRIKGVKRAAFAPTMPSKTGYVLLIDSGATVDGRAEFLNQYAILGSAYMKSVLGIDNPRVGLVNNGTEECKGTSLYIEAHKLLKENKDINFVGNIEGRGFMLGECDVLVADGFTGNILLKSCEGMGLFLLGELKKVFTAGLMTKIAYLLLNKQLRAFKKKADYREVGGAILLGLAKPIVKAHGSSDAKAFKSAICQAYNTVKSNMINNLIKTFEAFQTEE